MGEIYIITGPPGVGKTTAAKELASRKDMSAFIDGDDIYYLVHSGIVKPWETNNHLEVFWENIIDLVDNFISKNYDVVFNYICMPEDIKRLKEIFRSSNIYLSILIADEKSLIKRDKGRRQDHQMGSRAVLVLKEFKNMGYDERFFLDTSNLNIKETVDKIITCERYVLQKGDGNGNYTRK